MVHRKRRPIRIPTIIIPFLYLIVCCAIVSFVRPRRHNVLFETGAFPVVSIVRAISLPHSREVRFASQSNYFYARGDGDRADVYSPAGNKLYSLHLPMGSKLVLSGNGEYSMAYRERDPLDSHIEFFDSTGSSVWGMTVDGTVWCADSCACRNGARFVVGTSRGFVYVIDLLGRKRRFRRWRMPGAVVSVASDARGDGVYVATWKNSCIRYSSLRGRLHWQIDSKKEQLSMVSSLAGSPGVLVSSEPFVRNGNGSYVVIREKGKIVVSGDICLRENPSVVPAPTGRFVCVGTSKMIRHERKFIFERHARLTSESEGQLWEKGSPFFSVVPVAVTDKGCAIVSDGKSSLFLIAPSGQIRPSLKLASPVKHFAVSKDGRRLLALCSNNRAVLLNVTQ